MSQPRRFKTAGAPSREGRMMAAGCQELPDAEAVHRAAQRLGVSAAAIAAAAAATTIAPSAVAATTAISANGIGTAGAAVHACMQLHRSGVCAGVWFPAVTRWWRCVSCAATSFRRRLRNRRPLVPLRRGMFEWVLARSVDGMHARLLGAVGRME